LGSALINSTTPLGSNDTQLSALSGEHQPVSSLTLAGEPPAAPRFAVNLTPLSLLMRAFFCPLFDSPLSSRAALRSATRRDWSGLPSSLPRKDVQSISLVKTKDLHRLSDAVIAILLSAECHLRLMSNISHLSGSCTMLHLEVQVLQKVGYDAIGTTEHALETWV
ncbi:hypothetical protein XENOCAPTIV_009479, partial [Xenoophorus captivus]